jgi:hypothetical protein
MHPYVHTWRVSRMSKHLVSAVTIVVSVVAGFAARADATCAPYDRRYEQAPLMQVKIGVADGKVHFQQKPEPCPPEPQTCALRQRAYLVPGDVVFVSSENQGFRCAYYGTAKGDIVAGFLPVAALEAAEDDGNLNSSFLAGTWTMLGQNPITFSAAANGKVHATGKAAWQGRPGVVHSGSFSATVELQGDSAQFRDSDCDVKIRRRGPYLVASDNSRCGGMNVHFQGIYVKKTK